MGVWLEELKVKLVNHLVESGDLNNLDVIFARCALRPPPVYVGARRQAPRTASHAPRRCLADDDDGSGDLDVDEFRVCIRTDCGP